MKAVSYPERGRLELKAADHAGRVPGAALRIFESHAGKRFDATVTLPEADVRFAELSPGESGDLPGNADHTGAVRAVGRQADFQSPVLQGQRLGHRRSRRQRLGKDHEARVIFRQPHLVFCQKHPDGRLTANAAFFHLHASGQFCPGQSNRSQHAHTQVSGSAHHLHGALACFDIAKPQGICLGMGSHRQNSCGHHLLEGPAQRLLGFHLQTGHGEELGQVIHRQRDVHIIFKPVETYSHEKKRSALQILEYWSIGVMEYWSAGELEY